MRRAGLALLLGACSGSVGPEAISSAGLTAAANGADGDSADTACDIDLRTAWVNISSAGVPETDCSSGTCWAVVNATVDISTSADVLGATPVMLYESAVDGQWRQATMSPIWGAGLGFRRYSVRITNDTYTRASSSTMSLIPFLRTGGGRIFDHNRMSDVSSAYVLSAENGSQIQADASCPAPAPHGIETLVFAQGWQTSGYGSFVQNGKLDIDYDIYRIRSGLGCSTDSVRAFAVTAYARFAPSGVTRMERIDGPTDASGHFTSLPLEFDVPADATSASLWFLDSSECAGNEWDSQFGANYDYTVAAGP